MDTIKLFFNSVVSYCKAQYIMMDAGNFYLGTNLSEYKYLRIKLSDILQEIINQYELNKIAYKGWVYIEIKKAAYSLLQSGKLAHD